MSDHRIVDQCAGIGPGKHQRHLADNSVHYIALNLLQLIRVDGQGIHVPVRKQRFGRLCRIRIVQIAISVNAVGPVLKHGMTEYVRRIIMHVLPHQRNGLSVVILEGFAGDGAPIRAFDVEFGCPSAEVVPFVFHFEFSLP